MNSYSTDDQSEKNMQVTDSSDTESITKLQYGYLGNS